MPNHITYEDTRSSDQTETKKIRFGPYRVAADMENFFHQFETNKENEVWRPLLPQI